jgi:lysylphosphatidylglycerol synthetase-like protein (DUF2156 family)
MVAVRQQGWWVAAGRAGDLASEVIRWGNSVSSGALADERCRQFRLPGIEGLIGYRVGVGCAVVMGEPVCRDADKPILADAFHAFCRARGLATVYVVTAPKFTRWAIARGYAAVAFGEELILDPMRDPQEGAAGRELRKKINRAKKVGVAISEYVPSRFADADLERAMEEAAAAWLDGRRGPQIYITRLELFAPPREGKRWFYARAGERIVGAASLNRVDARGGWAIEHLVATPDSPQGVSESLVVEALAALGREGCRYATFGAAPARVLGQVAGFSRLSERFARAMYASAGRIFHLDARTRYRQKFQAVATEPAYLLFDPPAIGVRQIAAVLRAFNVSIQ